MYIYSDSKNYRFQLHIKLKLMFLSKYKNYIFRLNCFNICLDFF